MADLIRYVPVALLGAGCLLISGLREQKQVPPRAPMKALQLDVPAGMTPKDLEVPETERKIAGMSDYVMRVYQRDTTDAGFSVYLGYYDYQVQGKTIHSPKNCLPGAGWEPMQSGVSYIRPGVAGAPDSVPVNRYFLAKEGAQALVYYWYQGRGRVEANEYRVKWDLLRDAAVHGRTEEALVRIVVPLRAEDLRETARRKAAEVQADSLAANIARQLVVRVDKLLPAAPGTAAGA